MQSFAPTSRRRANRLLTCLCLLTVCAIECSTQQTKVPTGSASTPAAPTSDVTGRNLSGLWTGRTSTGGLLGMAGETRNIELVLRQVGDKITGSYRCYAGNSLCRNLDEKGSIDGTADGDRVNLNIMVLPDASNCRYTGNLNYNGNGQYACYFEGQIIEQGTWVATQ
jgi:hypothetical protein